MRHIFKANLLIYFNALYLLTGALNAAETNAEKEAPIRRPSPGGPQYDWILYSHQHDSGYHWPDKTNGLFLKLSWFLFPEAVSFCNVWADGRKSAGLATANGLQGGGGNSLDPTNFSELVKAVAHLPAPPTNQPPKERWLLVSGIRSNQWFTCIYDRADVPLEVDRLFEIAGASLQWALQNVRGSTNLMDLPGKPLTWRVGPAGTQNHRGYTLPINSHCLACAMSGDGKTAVASIFGISAPYEVYAFDCQSGKILWRKSQKEPDRAIGLAIVENEEALFLGLANSSVEKWNLATGEKIDSLESDPSGLRAMTVSRDGRCLAVSTGSGKIRVWDLERKSPPKVLTDSSTSLFCLEFSPDGRYLAVAGLDYRNAFVIWDWRAGTKILTRHYWNNSRPDAASSLAWSPDGKIFVVKAAGQAAVIFDAKTWKTLASWGPNFVDGGPGMSVTFSADGTLIGLPNSGPLEILDVPTLKRIEAREF